MRRFRCYRPNAPESYREKGHANAPEEVQFEGVEFSDGHVVVRWLTEHRSTSVWRDYAELMCVHGHPEYGTIIEWLDDPLEAWRPTQPREASQEPPADPQEWLTFGNLRIQRWKLEEFAAQEEQRQLGS